jgi:hypothetical protein
MIPAKLWNGQDGDVGRRRVIMLVLGVLVGLGALWLDYGKLGLPSSSPVWTSGPHGPKPLKIFGEKNGIPVAAAYMSYFGLMFFALKWWKLAERRRPQRFSLGPVLGAGFWAFVLSYMLLPLWPWMGQARGTVHLLPLLFASAIIQLVSPWQPQPPAPAKRMRLRYT